MLNKKEQQFIDWLCGKDVKFPFFQDDEDLVKTAVIGINQCSFWGCEASGEYQDEDGYWYCQEHHDKLVN